MPSDNSVTTAFLDAARLIIAEAAAETAAVILSVSADGEATVYLVGAGAMTAARRSSTEAASTGDGEVGSVISDVCGQSARMVDIRTQVDWVDALVKSLSSSPRKIRAHDRGQTFAIGWVGKFNAEFSGKPARVQSFALAIERAGHGR